MEERFKVDIMYRENLSWLAPDLVPLCFIASTMCEYIVQT